MIPNYSAILKDRYTGADGEKKAQHSREAKRNIDEIASSALNAYFITIETSDMQNSEYNFSKIEPKWQKYWAQKQTFVAEDYDSKPKFYILDMFPYPSGAGLHIGHPEGYTASDAYKRFKRAQGYNVLHPMGWDAFGLPTEQYAIKTGKHPKETTESNVRRFKEQLEQIGLCYDWNREINTTDPSYVKWTQWIFMQLFKKGLAYVEEKPVWFCPELGTVLANEEVLQGEAGPRSERGNHPVERRPIRQWVLKITQFADKLLSGLEGLDWPDSTKRLQANWIGRSEGARISFGIEAHEERIEVFTTRPDTLCGATYLVLAPEHPLVEKITRTEQNKAVEAYIEQTKTKSDLERAELNKEKTGVPSGAYAINPINQKRIPIWIADYVLLSYGTGAIMAVPAHDDRDFEFAQKFGIEILQVIDDGGSAEKDADGALTAAYTGSGKLIHSGILDGLESEKAKKSVLNLLTEARAGSVEVNYKLRDWLFSRQRYWGEPFPILWVQPSDYNGVDARFKPEGDAIQAKIEGEERCAILLSEDSLPLDLPQIENYNPSPDGQSPLSKAENWLKVHFDRATGCVQPEAGVNTVPAIRETNTMPQWAGSCWYYLRYIDPKNSEHLIDPKKEAYWKTPDLYIGGAEHAVLHLLYARFWHQVLHEIGVVSDPEPFKKLFHQGIILGEDGEKMSKSRGNVVNPEVIIDAYGADTLRLYLMFLGPLEAMKPWNTKGIEGIARFLRKLWRLIIIDNEGTLNPVIDASNQTKLDADSERTLHQSIEKVSADYEALSFNTAISQLMILLNQLAKLECIPQTTLQTFLQLIAPLAPHIAEELWERLGQASSISEASWPQVNRDKLVASTVKIIFQVNGKYRGDALLPTDPSPESVLQEAKSNPRVLAQLEGKTIVKEIYVPNKIVNFVVK